MTTIVEDAFNSDWIKTASKPSHPASEVGSEAWSALREQVHTAFDRSRPWAAVQLCIDAKFSGVTWRAIDSITRDAACRGLNHKVWITWQQVRGTARGVS